VTPWGWVLVALSAFLAGWLWGRASEAWDWRMSAGSDHHSHCSRGRWFHVFPAGFRPRVYCPACGRTAPDRLFEGRRDYAGAEGGTPDA
jgi:hypothetical protein